MITHPEKVLFPDDGITKGELAAYYEAMAPLIVPQVKGRPVTMERFPGGIGKPGFMQKNVAKGFPSWLQRIALTWRNCPGPVFPLTVTTALFAEGESSTRKGVTPISPPQAAPEKAASRARAGHLMAGCSR